MTEYPPPCRAARELSSISREHPYQVEISKTLLKVAFFESKPSAERRDELLAGKRAHLAAALKMQLQSALNIQRQIVLEFAPG
jgi:hypothetical protein